MLNLVILELDAVSTSNDT